MEDKMITAKMIASAKLKTKYSIEAHHEHDDCIRICYAWLDAQVKKKYTTRKNRPIKTIIENWAGRYVSASDVEVAATLHPEIKGSYPLFNIGPDLVRPSAKRLAKIPEAFTQNYEENPRSLVYSRNEEELT